MESSRSWRHANKAGASRERRRLTQEMRGLEAGDWTGITFKSGKEPLKGFSGGGGRKADLHLNLGGLEEQGLLWSALVGSH